MAHSSHFSRYGQPNSSRDTVLVDEMSFDEFEISILKIARFFFEALDKPNSQIWKLAFLKAESFFPIPFGASIAHAISIAIDSMCFARTQSFSYFANTHPEAHLQITNEEKYFLKAFQSIRQNKKSSAETFGLLVCEGSEINGFLATLERLAMITGDVQNPAYNTNNIKSMLG